MHIYYILYFFFGVCYYFCIIHYPLLQLFHVKTQLVPSHLNIMLSVCMKVCSIYVAIVLNNFKVCTCRSQNIMVLGTYYTFFLDTLDHKLCVQHALHKKIIYYTWYTGISLILLSSYSIATLLISCFRQKVYRMEC